MTSGFLSGSGGPTFHVAGDSASTGRGFISTGALVLAVPAHQNPGTLSLFPAPRSGASHQQLGTGHG